SDAAGGDAECARSEFALWIQHRRDRLGISQEPCVDGEATDAREKGARGNEGTIQSGRRCGCGGAAAACSSCAISTLQRGLPRRFSRLVGARCTLRGGVTIDITAVAEAPDSDTYHTCARSAFQLSRRSSGGPPGRVPKSPVAFRTGSLTLGCGTHRG